MNWKQIINDYLTFSKRDRIGLLFIIGFTVLVYAFTYFFTGAAGTAPPHIDSTLLVKLDTLKNASYPEQKKNTYADYHSVKNNFGFKKLPRFAFDPNTLSFQGWVQLGLNEKTAKTIIKYRSKGGKFYKPEDLRKIWTLPEGFYEYVSDFIVIPNDQHFKVIRHHEKEQAPYSSLKPVNVNSADTGSLIAMPGIGSKLANRIIHFRDKLGGFYSVDQIGETYGLSDSVFQSLKERLTIDEKLVRKININLATKDVLKAHPYISWNLANAMVEYRNRHGEYKSLSDLKNIALMDEKLYGMLIPYFTLNDSSLEKE